MPVQNALIDPTALGPWPELVVAAAAIIGVALLYLLYSRAVRMDERLKDLEGLARLEESLGELKEGASGVDLERVEHLLEDLRDANRRIGRQLIDLTEQSVTEPDPHEPNRPVGPLLGERITNRLIVLGCERIELLIGAGDLERIAAEGGEVGFEARRDGAMAKGRVEVSDGRLVNVDISTSHQMFP